MEETADAEHRRNACGERDRSRARDDAVRGQRQRDAEGNRDEEAKLERDAAEARSRRAVAGRLT
jgi:hypothetical protein